MIVKIMRKCVKTQRNYIMMQFWKYEAEFAVHSMAERQCCERSNPGSYLGPS
jgi:hypothetical protein